MRTGPRSTVLGSASPPPGADATTNCATLPSARGCSQAIDGIPHDRLQAAGCLHAGPVVLLARPRASDARRPPGAALRRDMRTPSARRPEGERASGARVSTTDWQRIRCAAWPWSCLIQLRAAWNRQTGWRRAPARITRSPAATRIEGRSPPALPAPNVKVITCAPFRPPGTASTRAWTGPGPAVARCVAARSTPAAKPGCANRGLSKRSVCPI